MAKGEALAAAPNKKAAQNSKKSADKKIKAQKGQAELVSALNAHTEALHRFSSVLESVQPLVVSGKGSLSKDEILAELAVYFKKPDLTMGIDLAVVSAGPIGARAKQIDNIKAFKQRGLGLTPNDFDDLKSVGDLVDKIWGMIG